MNKSFPKEEIYKYEFLVPVIADCILGTGRWSINHKVIFKYEDKLWETTYSEGATEMQDERPFEYETMIDCIEVKPVERVMTVYEPVDDSKTSGV